ncbi:MAG: ABC transporter substrate-binding protein, partial [Actinobacteria bacterium]|nr:ABC transporter substrate-binding protein [Actinomycetota bacterium]
MAALTFLPLLVACGGGGGGNTVNWYVFKEPGGAYDQAAATCSQQSGGRYVVKIQDLPTNADTQREQLVRRLAAKDASVDILGMDVIWTGEFAEAGWIKPFTPEQAAEISKGVLAGPLQTATYKGQLWAAPSTSNTQLLWYRKDRVPTPPQTWDQMIDMATKLQNGQLNYIEVQANRYEGYTVWFNALLASAGGSVVVPGGGSETRISLEPQPTEAALDVIKKLATSSAADPSISNATEDTTRLAFQSGKATFMVNYPFVYPSAQKDAPDVFANMGWARYPAVTAGQPSKPPLGGINLGIGAYSKHPDLAYDAVRCLISEDNQIVAAVKGGLPPTLDAAYDRPEMKTSYPFGDLIRQSLRDAAPRPVAPAYNDISLAIQ